MRRNVQAELPARDLEDSISSHQTPFFNLVFEANSFPKVDSLFIYLVKKKSSEIPPDGYWAGSSVVVTLASQDLNSPRSREVRGSNPLQSTTVDSF